MTRRASPPDFASIVAGHVADAAAFSDWLAERLGDYRESVENAFSASAIKADADRLREALAAAESLAAAMASPEGLGLRGSAAASYAAHHDLGADFHAVRRRLRVDLGVLKHSLTAALAALKRMPVARGRRPLVARSLLLRAVVARLRQEMPAAAARKLAEQLLIAARIPAPAQFADEPDKLRAIRRAERAGG